MVDSIQLICYAGSTGKALSCQQPIGNDSK